MVGEGSGWLLILVALGVAGLGLLMGWNVLRQRPSSRTLEKAEHDAVRDEYNDQRTR